MVYIFGSLLSMREYDLMLLTSTTKTSLAAKLLNYQYNKLCKTFSKFYNIHSKLIIKYNGGLKTLLE